MAAIEGAARYRENVEREIQLLVAEAHARGASWADIAERLGCSRQSAHERYKASIHSEPLRDQLESDVMSAMTYANDLSLSNEAGEEEAEEAFLFLEEKERFTWLD
jgi:hypothetical protein